jgi:Uma2 family endonuclease
MRRTIAYVSEAISFLPFDSFLDQEEASEERHDLVGGRVYAQAGGSERHDLAAGLIYEAVAASARAAGCRPFTANRLLRTSNGNAYYPDVMVVCGPAAHRLYETSASLIVEVLSPSTADVDRREKAVAYAVLPALRHLVLVHPDVRRLEVARPAGGSIEGWAAFGPGDVVRTGYGDLDVDSLYDLVDRTATAP